MPENVWVVIPTYNEAKNIEALARAVTDELRRLDLGDYRVLVVDDNSPDGTGTIVDRLVLEVAQVEVLHRPGKQGLGRAYLAGFHHAIERGADVLVEMDADFSHDPKYLPGLIRASATADLVIGSRYVSGGAVRDWPLARRLISRGGSLYARAILGVGVRDLTGGFKAINRRVLEGIDLPTISAQGYGFQIEVTYRAIQMGFKVTEVPIVFTDRTAGVSKMSFAITAEALRLVPELRFGGPAWTRRGVSKCRHTA